MRAMIKHPNPKFENEAGQDLLEYALLVALIALVAIAAITAAGGNISAIFHKIAAVFH